MAGIQTIGTTFTMKKIAGEDKDMVVANLTSIGEQSTEIEEIDVTALDSPNGAKEYIAGAMDSGTVDIEGNVKTKGQVTTLDNVFTSRKNRDFVVCYPNGDMLKLNGYISTFKFGEATTDGLYTFGFTLKLSGKPEFVEGKGNTQ